MSVLRDLRYVATEAAHLALDVVEHFARCYAPVPDYQPASGADQLAEREAEEEVADPTSAALGALRGNFWCNVHKGLVVDCPTACETRIYRYTNSSPAAASAGTAGVCGEAESEPPPASPQINLTQWLQPAIQEALAEHEAYDYAGHVECPHYRGGSEVCDDWMAWREHVSEDIAEHVVVALSAWLGRPL